MSAPSNGLVLDYFAGSGTTSHAVINLNNSENLRMKFINVEMGNHFNSVVIPRLKKLGSQIYGSKINRLEHLKNLL